MAADVARKPLTDSRISAATAGNGVEIANNSNESADWTALADLTLAAPVVLRGTVKKAKRLSGRAAMDVPAGELRMLVELALANVVKAPDLLPAGAEFLWQGRPGADGRPPLKAGQDLLAFLEGPLPGPKPEIAQFRLVAPQALRGWTAERDAAVRAVLAEARDGPGVMVTGQMVTGVSDAFRSEGDVAGVSESQFFLLRAGGQPMTLLVTRAPDAAPLVRVATGDVIGASAAAVRPRTLLWRALACGLPPALPKRLAGDAALAADYALALERLGPCGPRGIIPTTR